MNKISLLLVIAFSGLLLISSCKPEESKPNSELTVNFNKNAGSEKYTLGTAVTNTNGQHYQLNLFKFYISNLELVRTDGTTRKLGDIFLVDFNENLQSANPALIGKSFKFTVDEENNFTALKFDVGVKTDLNGTSNTSFNPAQYADDHPLSLNQNNYWMWASGYRFVMLEGKIDTTSSGQAPQVGFGYHTGLDTFYRSVTLNKPVTFQAGSNQTLNIDIDIHKIFNSDNNSIDMVKERSTDTSPNNPKEMDIARRITENFVNALN